MSTFFFTWDNFSSAQYRLKAILIEESAPASHAIECKPDYQTIHQESDSYLI